MNEIQREEKFRKWLTAKVETATPLYTYIRALHELIPQKLNELNEGQYKNLFLCTDLRTSQN
jgi:hypothetical protein